MSSFVPGAYFTGEEPRHQEHPQDLGETHLNFSETLQVATNTTRATFFSVINRLPRFAIRSAPNPLNDTLPPSGEESSQQEYPQDQGEPNLNGIQRVAITDSPVPPTQPLPPNEPETNPESESESDDDDMPKLIGNVPPTFNGDTRSAQGWVLQVEAYLDINDEVYESDKKKIVFFLSLMTKGEAAKWAEGQFKKAAAEKAYGTYETFLKLFVNAFYPKNLTDTAIRRISTLKQTGSVAAYASLFRTILADTGINEENVKIMFFRNGLKRDIVSAVLAFKTIPSSIDDWLTKALEVESRRLMLNPPSNHRSRDPYAMDIDHTELGEEEERQVKKMYLSPQERKRRRKNGLCFKCGKKGLIKDCPNHLTVSTRPAQTAAKKVGKDEDDEYQEFLEWKAFGARQMKKNEYKDFA